MSAASLLTRLFGVPAGVKIPNQATCSAAGDYTVRVQANDSSGDGGGGFARCAIGNGRQRASCRRRFRFRSCRDRAIRDDWQDWMRRHFRERRSYFHSCERDPVSRGFFRSDFQAATGLK